MPTESKPRQCRHLFTDGRQCGSNSLRSEHFCYYHHTTRVPAPRPSRTQSAASNAFALPMPENRAAIQHAIGEVLRRVAALQISSKTASLLFYGLSIASANLPRPTRADVIALPTAEPVRDIVSDPEDGLIAPAEEPLQEGQSLTTPAQLIRDQYHDWERQAAEEMDQIKREQQARKPVVVPPLTPELERLLRINPPPAYIPAQPYRLSSPPQTPEPWQRAAPGEALEAAPEATP